jgi:tetratricopeptide (TPR) repeat protein
MLSSYVLLAALSRPHQHRGQSYAGADAALRAIQVAPSQPVKTPADDFRRAITAYGRESRSMPPAESARRWLTLADRAEPDDPIFLFSDGTQSTAAFSEVIRALPGPAVWGDLENQLRRRPAKAPNAARNFALLAMFEELLGHRNLVTQHLSQIRGLTPEQAGLLALVQVQLALKDGTGEQIEHAYLQLAKALSSNTQPVGGDKSISLPDLDMQVGTERAKAILRTLFLNLDGEVVIEHGGLFAKTARELALAIADKLRHPQWSLAIAVDGGPLFAAMHGRFPAVGRGIQQNPDGAPSSYAAAAEHYLAYLVANDRSPEALAFANNQASSYWLGYNVADDEIELLRNHGRVEAFAALLEAIVTRGVDDGATMLYASYSRAVGLKARADRFIAALPPSRRTWVPDPTDQDVEDLVEHQKIEAAGNLLVSRLRTRPLFEANYQGYPNAASELVDIGRYLHRQEWVELGISAAEKSLRGTDDEEDADWVCRELIRNGRGPEAEQLLADDLNRKLHQEGSSSSPFGSAEIVSLARFYASLGRYSDVVVLLDEANNWEHADLAFLQDLESHGRSIPFLAAKSLAAVGRTREALRVLLFVLQSQRELDQAYELLISIDPDAAGTLLNRMHESSPSATRPVIWKAELLRRQGRTARAASLIWRAIAMDPQDMRAWESHTRFQAWAILAAIERDEGKARPAKAHQRKFDSPGKLFWNDNPAGSHLDLGPTPSDEPSLEDNPDDFWLKFNIADKLQGKGAKDAARAQIREACRLIPEQIGPATDILWPNEPALAALCEAPLLAKLRVNPASSLANAALGSLYHAIGRDAEAKAFDLKAIARDHDCLMAWDGLYQVMQNRFLGLPLEDEVSQNLLRLNPFAETYFGLSVNHFARLWTMIDTETRSAVYVDEPVYLLPSAGAVAETDSAEQNLEWPREHNWPPTGGSMVAADHVISSMVALISSLGSGRQPRGAEQ